MRYGVSGEGDLRVFVKSLRDEIAERVIFLVEREDCGVWYAFRIVSSEKRELLLVVHLRVSSFHVIFFSPSASRKSSNRSEASHVSR